MRKNAGIIALLIALVASGCPPKSRPQGEVPRPEPAAPIANTSSEFPEAGACDAATAKRVDRWLGAWREWHQDGAQHERPEHGYVVRDGKRFPAETIMVRVTAEGLFVDHRLVSRPPDAGSTSRALHDQLAAAREAWAEKGVSEPTVALAIESNVDGKRVLDLAPFVADLQPAIAFEAPPIAPPYWVPQSVRDAHPELYQPSQQRLSRTDVESHVYDCDSMARVGAMMEKARPLLRWRVLERHLGSAWVECGCAEELDLPRDLAAATARFEHRPLATAGNVLDRSAAPVVVQDGDSWADIATRLPNDEPVWFVPPAGSQRVLISDPSPTN